MVTRPRGHEPGGFGRGDMDRGRRSAPVINGTRESAPPSRVVVPRLRNAVECLLRWGVLVHLYNRRGGTDTRRHLNTGA